MEMLKRIKARLSELRKNAEGEEKMERKSVRDVEDTNRIPAIDVLIREKRIIYGLVTGTNFNALDKAEEMIVRVPEGVLGKGQMSAVIRREDADNVFSSGTVNYLVGHTVPFVITKEEDGKVFASRKLAQDMLRKEMGAKSRVTGLSTQQSLTSRHSASAFPFQTVTWAQYS